MAVPCSKIENFLRLQSKNKSRQQRLALAAVAALLALTVAPTVQAVEGQEHMWDDRMPPLFSMGDLPEDVLWMMNTQRKNA